MTSASASPRAAPSASLAHFKRARIAHPLPRPSHPLLDRLWTRYAHDVPAVARFTALAGGVFENDHVAFRTLKQAGGIATIARIFERAGWRHGGDYLFPDVHLRAVHLSQPGLPRIFVSELDADALPSGARAALRSIASAPDAPDDFDALAAWFGEGQPASRADLETVQQASQYGAWLLAFGRRVNHFTARVDDIEAWQQRLLDAGVVMKAEIEGARGGALRQTATEAAPLVVKLANGQSMMLPYAYFEIAQRVRGFDGFLGPQARQLFEMTNVPPVRKGIENRRFARMPATLHVEVAYGKTLVGVHSDNISMGGVFLNIGDTLGPRQHEAVELKIELGAGSVIDVLGTVVYVVPGRGVGVEFSWWDDAAHPGKPLLSEFLARA